MDGGTPTETLREVELDLVDESPTNPRTRFDQAALEELAASIRGKGLISPVTLRPKPDGRYELVVGARRGRASRLAGCTTILALVRDLSDREVLEIQLEENGQREDVHPLEEADAYARLRDQGADLAELAARTGKSVSYVRHRLQYCALGAEGREAFLDGKLTPATALLVARVPAGLQARAVADLTQLDFRGEPMPARVAGSHIRSRFMLALAEAPFDRGAADLVYGAGPCTTCPKRTGAQPELFADVESPDTCTDPECFAAKRDAAWELRKAAAKATGQAVLSEKDTKKVFSYGSQVAYDSDFVEVTKKAYDIGEGERSYGEVLGEHLPDVVVARDESGGVHELIRKSDLKDALKAAGFDAKAAPRTSSSDDQKRAKEKLALRSKVFERALEALVGAAAKAKADLALWKLLASLFIAQVFYENAKSVVKRRGVVDPKGKGEQEVLQKLAATMTEAELRGLMVELLCARPPSLYRTDFSDPLRDACKHFKVDLKSLESTVRAELTAAKKAKLKGAKSSKPKARAKPSKPATEAVGADEPRPTRDARRVLILHEDHDRPALIQGLPAWSPMKTPGAGAQSGGDARPLMMIYTSALDSGDVEKLLIRATMKGLPVLDLGVIEGDEFGLLSPADVHVREKWNTAHPSVPVSVGDAPDEDLRVVFCIGRKVWDGLSEKGRDQLRRPDGKTHPAQHVAWTERATVVRSEPLDDEDFRHTVLERLSERFSLVAVSVEAPYCRACGCIEAIACPGGCAWADETKMLCTACVSKASAPETTSPPSKVTRKVLRAEIVAQKGKPTAPITTEAPTTPPEGLVEIELDDFPTHDNELDIYDEKRIVLWTGTADNDRIRTIVPAEMAPEVRRRAEAARVKVTAERPSEGPLHVVEIGGMVAAPKKPMKILGLASMPDGRIDALVIETPDGPRVAMLDAVQVTKGQIDVFPSPHYVVTQVDGAWQYSRVDEPPPKGKGKGSKKAAAPAPAAESAPTTPAVNAPTATVRVEQVPADVLAVISTMTTEGNAARITAGDLERKLYERTNRVLEALGGKWDKKAKAHLFSTDPAPLLEGVMLTGEVARARDVLGYFPTPSGIVHDLLLRADGAPGMKLLEPSAGEGAIVGPALLAGYRVTAVEIDPVRHRALVARYVSGNRNAAGEIAGLASDVCGDFLTWVTPERFDRVVMNPPFAQQQDIDHVTRAFDLLAPGGRLVAVMSAGVLFRDNAKTRDFRNLVWASRGKIYEQPAGSFRSSGTGVSTVIVTMERDGGAP